MVQGTQFAGLHVTELCDRFCRSRSSSTFCFPGCDGVTLLHKDAGTLCFPSPDLECLCDLFLKRFSVNAGSASVPSSPS